MKSPFRSAQPIAEGSSLIRKGGWRLLARRRSGISASSSRRTGFAWQPSLEDSGIGMNSPVGHLMYLPFSACWLKIQPNNDTLGLGEVPNDLFDRWRKPSYQGWNGDDLIAFGQLRFLQQIDDFYAVLAVQLFLANLLEIGDRGNRIRSLTGYVKPQYKKITPAGVGGALLFGTFLHVRARFLV